MSLEGIVGLAAGLAAGSIALAGWAAGSVIEGLASIIVIWRFTGARVLAESTEERAQKAVAVSFWLLVPWITAGAIYDLAGDHPASTTVIGLVITASSVIIMPALGLIKHRLGCRLDSGATAGEGTQNLICAAQAAAVLTGLAVVAAWPAGWAADPLIALAIAGWSRLGRLARLAGRRLLLTAISRGIFTGMTVTPYVDSNRGQGKGRCTARWS